MPVAVLSAAVATLLWFCLVARLVGRRVGGARAPPESPSSGQPGSSAVLLAQERLQLGGQVVTAGHRGVQPLVVHRSSWRT